MYNAHAIRTRVAMCITRDDEMLFVEHAKEGRRYWLLPGGGVEMGETMIEAARRELLEETGYTTDVGRLLVVCESIEPGGRHVINLVFVGAITGGELVPGHDHALVGAAWHKRAAIPALETYPPIGNTLLACWDVNFTGPVRYLGNVWQESPTS